MALITDDVAARAPGGVREAHEPRAAGGLLAGPGRPGVRAGGRLVEELAALDPQLTAESYNFVLDTEKVEELGIARIPGHRDPGRGRRTTASASTACPRATSSAAWWTRSSTSRSGDSGLERGDAHGAGGAEAARPHAGLLDAHLTVLPPGGPPGLPVRDGERPRHRRRRRGDGLPRPRAAVPRVVGARRRWWARALEFVGAGPESHAAEARPGGGGGARQPA